MCGTHVDGARAFRGRAAGVCFRRGRITMPTPFDLSILLARLQRMMRRSQWQKSGQESRAKKTPDKRVEARAFDDAALPRMNSDIFLDRKSIDFGTPGTPLRPCDPDRDGGGVLRHLIRNEGRIVSRSRFLEDVWGLHEDTDTRAIDNYHRAVARYIEEDPADRASAYSARSGATAFWLSRISVKAAAKYDRVRKSASPCVAPQCGPFSSRQ